MWKENMATEQWVFGYLHDQLANSLTSENPLTRLLTNTISMQSAIASASGNQLQGSAISILWTKVSVEESRLRQTKACEAIWCVLTGQGTRPEGIYVRRLVYGTGFIGCVLVHDRPSVLIMWDQVPPLGMPCCGDARICCACMTR